MCCSRYLSPLVAENGFANTLTNPEKSKLNITVLLIDVLNTEFSAD